MINFDEEVKKFRPCMEIEQLNDQNYKQDMTDMTDILKSMYSELDRERAGTGVRR